MIFNYTTSRTQSTIKCLATLYVQMYFVSWNNWRVYSKVGTLLTHFNVWILLWNPFVIKGIIVKMVKNISILYTVCIDRKEGNRFLECRLKSGV